MSDDDQKKIIHLSAARRKRSNEKRAGAYTTLLPKKRGLRRGGKEAPGKGWGREWLATGWRWIQFLFLIALTAYILQQCGRF